MKSHPLSHPYSSPRVMTIEPLTTILGRRGLLTTNNHWIHYGGLGVTVGWEWRFPGPRVADRLCAIRGNLEFDVNRNRHSQTFSSPTRVHADRGCEACSAGTGAGSHDRVPAAMTRGPTPGRSSTGALQAGEQSPPCYCPPSLSLSISIRS